MAKQGNTRDRPNPRHCPSIKLVSLTGRRSFGFHQGQRSAYRNGKAGYMTASSTAVSSHAIPGASIHAIPGASIHAIPGASIHAIPGASIHAIPGASIHAIPGASIHAIPGASIHAIPGASIHDNVASTKHVVTEEGCPRHDPPQNRQTASIGKKPTLTQPDAKTTGDKSIFNR